MLVGKLFNNIPDKLKYHEFRNLSFDSRNCKLKDIFFSIKGTNSNGNKFIKNAIKNGIYTKDKINTFVSVFPISNPKFVLLVLLDEPKPSKEYIYHYRDERTPYKGNWRNTAGWTTVLIVGNIIEKIGPILATKY